MKEKAACSGRGIWSTERTIPLRRLDGEEKPLSNGQDLLKQRGGGGIFQRERGLTFPCRYCHLIFKADILIPTAQKQNNGP